MQSSLTNDINIMSNIIRTIKKRITFKQIFSEQWEPFKSQNKIET